MDKTWKGCIYFNIKFIGALPDGMRVPDPLEQAL